MSCLNVKFTREERLAATFSRKGGLTARFGLVCATDIGRPEKNVLYASDGGLLTIDGTYLIVREDG